jgi:hypothetical protein
MRFCSFWKPVLTAAAVVGLFLGVGAGCASKAGGDGSTTTPLAVSRGMYCPKCETVWVSQPVGQGTKVVRMEHRREMKCPTCDATAASYLTGDGMVMMHECPECKATPIPLRPSTGPSAAAGG